MRTWQKELLEDPALLAMGLVPARAAAPGAMPNQGALNWRAAWLAIGIGTLLLFGLFWPTVAHTVNTWIGSATFNHGFLILPICGYLFWIKRGMVASLVPQPSWWGGALMVGAGSLWLLGNMASVALVQQFALVGMIYALFLAVLGIRLVWVLAFPLFYLVFAVPFGEFMVQPLQDLTAVFVVKGLRLIDIPVFLDGVFLSIPTGNFEVAEACAGVRFLIATIALGFLFAYITYTGWIRRGAFLLLCFIVPIVANGLRAFGIVYIAYLTNNEVAVGVDHIVYGWIFFAFVTLVLLSLGMLFRDAPVADTAPDPGSVGGPAGYGVTPRRIVVVAGVALIGAIIMPAYAAIIDMRPRPAAPAMLSAPAVGGGWAPVDVRGRSDWLPVFVGADRTLTRSYTKNGHQVDLFLAYYTRERQGAELISNENRIVDGKRWSRASSHTVRARVDGGETTAIMTRLRGQGRGRLVLHWYWIAGRYTANPYVAKALQALDRLRGGTPAAAVVLGAAYDDLPAEAEALFRDFLANAGAFAPEFRRAAGG